MRRFRSGLEQKKNNIFYGDTLTKRVLSCIFINGNSIFNLFSIYIIIKCLFFQIQLCFYIMPFICF